MEGELKYSFILPAYKSKYLKESLDSILSQTYPYFEVVVVNDASPEDIDSIIHSYHDSRISYYINQYNIGGKNLVSQWNHCLNYAKGDYVILASDDDIYAPDFLRVMSGLVEKYPCANVFRPRIQLIDKHNNIIALEGYTKEYMSRVEFLYALSRGYIESGIPYYIFKKTSLLSMGGFVDYPLAWHSDDATVFELADNGVVSTNDILFSFRWSEESISSKSNSKKTLISKINATTKFYEKIYEFINSYESTVLQEASMVSWLKVNWCIFISENKIRNQLFSATTVVVFSMFSEIIKLSYVTKRQVIRWYLSYLKTLF